MDVNTRIQQFRQMSEADPENELGHFSLGKALLDAGRPEEALQPLRRAIGVNRNLSKAYQMLGEALEQTGQRDEAIEVVTTGVTIADAQGDRMPRDAMADRLRTWGAPVPAFKSAAPSALSPAETDADAAAAGGAAAGFACGRCGKPAGRLPKPPFKGPLGERIFNNVCQACWREWIGMGTKVINELGLVLSTKSGQDTYDQYMIEFLQLEDR